MTIVKMFISFATNILSFKVFNIELIDYLIGFTIIIFIFKIFNILGNNTSVKKNKKETKGKEE